MLYILQANSPGITEYLNAVTILGMPLATFMVVVMISLAVLTALAYFWWNNHKLSQNKKNTRGRIVAEFVSESGGKVWRELCEVYKMEVKKVENKSRAVFMADAYINAPKNSSIDAYYVLPEHDYLEVWPLNAKPQQQVILQKYYFVENDPCPKMPHDPSKWDQARYIAVTSAIAKLAKDESNLQVLVSEMSGVWQNIADFVQKLKMIPILMYMLGGLALINLFTAFMVFQSNQGIQQLVKFLVGAPTK
jgi:hypothetical protein